MESLLFEVSSCKGIFFFFKTHQKYTLGLGYSSVRRVPAQHAQRSGLPSQPPHKPGMVVSHTRNPGM